MGAETATLSQDTLHQALLERLPQLRLFVHRKIPTRLASTVSADDVLQEVWIAAYRTLPTFVPDGPNAIDRWLMTIAKRKVANVIQAARAVKRGGGKTPIPAMQKILSSYVDLFARVRSPQQTPSGEFHTLEIGHAVAVALRRLSEDRRRAVYMRHIEGRPLKEIARLMEKTEASINSLLYHGLRDLQSLLGDAAKFFSDARTSEAGKLADSVDG